MKVNNRQKLSPTRRPKNTRQRLPFGEVVVIAKDIFEVLWKLAPAFLVPAGLTLWQYLAMIHWTSLFYESAMSGTGLVFLVLAAIVAMFVVLIIFLIPSVIIVTTSQVYEQSGVHEDISNIQRAAFFAWFLSMSLLIVDNNLSFWVPLTIPMLVASLAGARQFRSELLSANKVTRKTKTWMKIVGLSAAAEVAMIGTIYPMLFAFEVGTQIEGQAGWRESLAIFLCIVIASIGVIPGVMYLTVRGRSPDDLKRYKVFTAGALGVAITLLTLSSLFVPMQNKLLEVTGIFDTETSTYQVLKPELVDAFVATGIPVDRTVSTPTVTVFIRYRFGAVRLACLGPFTPENASSEMIRLAKRESRPNPGVLGGSQCVPTFSGELREYRAKPS